MGWAHAGVPVLFGRDTAHHTLTGRETHMLGKRQCLRGALTGLAVVALLATSAAALEVGQKAPDFTLAAPDGKQVKLGDLLVKGPVVIYTFIQAFTGT